MRRLPMIFVAVLLASAGCETDFSPKGPFEDRMVVFGILTPSSSAQIVRLESTYDPPGFNPLDHTTSTQTINAQVSLTEDRSTVFVLRDTTLRRTDTGRYQDSIKAFVASPLTVVRGTRYTLDITSPVYGTLTANTTVPGTGFVDVALSSIPSLTNPLSFQRDLDMIAFISPATEGNKVQMFVEYEVPSLNPGVALLEEVPLAVKDQLDCVTFDATYPLLRRRTQLSGQEVWTFPHANYMIILRKILKMHEPRTINFRRVVLVLVQADQHLYRYSSLVNGFQDEFSIRVDQPNYTNIQGGLGVFGAFTLDSASVALPSSFPGLSCP